VLGYSSDFWYGLEGSFSEPMGRESLQRLWQKYKVDIAFYGHVHNYERTCPIYQVSTIVKYTKSLLINLNQHALLVSLVFIELFIVGLIMLIF
jgi:hypothetical protein